MCRKYKPNNVYVLEIDGKYYYGGCHTRKDLMTENIIFWGSANPFRRAWDCNLITTEEYKNRCKIILIEEYDSKEEAENREIEIIAELKEKYGELCLNKSKGNKYGGCSGVTHSEETRKKMSEARKGSFFSEEHKEHLAQSNRNNPKQPCKKVQQFTLDGQFIAEYPSVSEAARQTGIRQGNISSCLTGHLKTAGGFIWQYKGTN